MVTNSTISKVNWARFQTIGTSLRNISQIYWDSPTITTASCITDGIISPTTAASPRLCPKRRPISAIGRPWVPLTYRKSTYSTNAPAQNPLHRPHRRASGPGRHPAALDLRVPPVPAPAAVIALFGIFCWVVTMTEPVAAIPGPAAAVPTFRPPPHRDPEPPINPVVDFSVFLAHYSGEKAATRPRFNPDNPTQPNPTMPCHVDFTVFSTSSATVYDVITGSLSFLARKFCKFFQQLAMEKEKVAKDPHFGHPARSKNRRHHFEQQQWSEKVQNLNKVKCMFSTEIFVIHYDIRCVTWPIYPFKFIDQLNDKKWSRKLFPQIFSQSKNCWMG